jgi:phage/plasmid-associated DNA primase
MEALFEAYKKHFKLDEYCEDPEALALREKMFGDTVKEVIKPKKKGKKK